MRFSGTLTIQACIFQGNIANYVSEAFEAIFEAILPFISD